MDNAVLIPVVEELKGALVGSALSDIVQIDSRRFALRFSVPPFRRLCVTLHPDLSELHLASHVAAPKPPTELASVLTERLAGATLAVIRKEREERCVELEFEGGKHARGVLVLELLGKASNLLLLDEDRRIVRFLRSHGGAFRKPEEGAPYVPPPPRRTAEALPWGSRLLSREIDALAGGGVTREKASEAIGRRMAGSDWAPCLYSARPLEETGEAEELHQDDLFPAPFQMKLGEGLVCKSFGTASDLAAAYAELRWLHLAFRDLRGALALLVRGEKERSARLVETLEREAREAREAGTVRRRGELLLASLGSARKEGGEVEIVDYFDPAMPRVRIPVDPRLDLRGNAEASFRKARKLDRAAKVISERLSETRRRSAALETVSLRISGARSTEELEAIETELNRSGLVRVFRKPERRAVGRKPAFVRVREYRTHDGLVVLVGKTAAENDLLTFKIAAPHDFWFHAAGRSGAHVVVRNPKRSKDLPETTLMEAAGIAAWFSKGPREGEIDVHYAQRKEVRKGKGMSPGMVMLRRYRTIRARPALPRGAPAGEGT